MTLIINNAKIGYIDCNTSTNSYFPKELELDEQTLDYLHIKLENLNTLNNKEVILPKTFGLFGLDFDLIVEYSFKIIEGAVHKISNHPNTHILLVDYKDNDNAYQCLIKLNNKFIDNVIASSLNDSHLTIAKTSWEMPNAKAKVEEAIILDNTNRCISIIEKKMQIDDRKDFYLNMLLKGEVQLSDKEVINTLLKVFKKINDIYKLYDKTTFIAKFNKYLFDTANEMRDLLIQEFVDDLIKDYQANEEACVMLDDLGINRDRIIRGDVLPTKYENVKIVTDNDIEIKIPSTSITEEGVFKTEENYNDTKTILLGGVHYIETK